MKPNPFLFVALGFLAGACFLASPALSHAQNQKADYYRGLDLYNAGDYKGAVLSFKEQLKKTPDDEMSLKWLGLAVKQLGRNTIPEKQAPAAETAPEEDPGESVFDSPAPALPVPASMPVTTGGTPADDYENGIALYMKEKYPEALECFKRYLGANPDHAASRQWISILESLGAQNKSPGQAPKPASGQNPAPFSAPAPRFVPAPPPPVSVPAPETRQREIDDLKREIDFITRENKKLRQEAADSAVLAERAISQTRKALALQPSPNAESPSQFPIEEKKGLEARIAAMQQEAGLSQKKMSETQDTLKEFTNLYRQADQSRKLAEARLVETLKENQALKQEMSNLDRYKQDLYSAQQEAARVQSVQMAAQSEAAAARASAQNLARETQNKESQIALLRKELADKETVLLEERARSEQSLRRTNQLLEESRQQGLELAQNLQAELKTRQELEARLLEARRHELEMQKGFQDLNQQMNQTLPRLQSIQKAVEQSETASNKTPKPAISGSAPVRRSE